MSNDKYIHADVEDKIYSYWEKNNLFKPKSNKVKKQFVTKAKTKLSVSTKNKAKKAKAGKTKKKKVKKVKR